jgi:hypothetical protein
MIPGKGTMVVRQCGEQFADRVRWIRGVFRHRAAGEAVEPTSGTTAFTVAVVLAVVLAGCGQRQMPTPGAPHHAALSCRGMAPWTGATARRCARLVSRWAPVTSLHLTTRLPSRVLSTCAEARRQARIPVVCPPLLPSGGVVADPGLYGAHVLAPPRSTDDLYFVTFNNGENAGHTHWIVGAGRGRSTQKELFDGRSWDVPGRVRQLGARRYGPWAIAFYRFPPHPSGGALGGHDLALVRRGAMTYFATVHGHRHHDADAAMLIAVLLSAGAA